MKSEMRLQAKSHRKKVSLKFGLNISYGYSHIVTLIDQKSRNDFTSWMNGFLENALFSVLHIHQIGKLVNQFTKIFEENEFLIFLSFIHFFDSART